MDSVKQWWYNDLPVGIKIVLLVLLANAMPATLILWGLPTKTDQLFVWTIKPVINAHLIGVMYTNALILIAIGAMQTSWARIRIIMVVITLFSILATLLTFFFLKPFLAHPWFHLAYWLSMYFVLFFAAPIVFVQMERKEGGHLPVQLPLNAAARGLAVVFLLSRLQTRLALTFRVESVNQVLPWQLPPLVAGLIGVLFFTHAAAYGWALWDGDWRRTRPIFWQAPPTALLFLTLPLFHPADLRPDAGTATAVYLTTAALAGLLSLGLIITYRSKERATPSHA
ncbi:MAG: hypothetical protein ACE5EY_01780 [Anaerolineae bacterium]